jgi:hypothetical protein
MRGTDNIAKRPFQLLQLCEANHLHTCFEKVIHSGDSVVENETSPLPPPPPGGRGVL